MEAHVEPVGLAERTEGLFERGQGQRPADGVAHRRSLRALDGGEVWNTEKMTTDEEWIAFAKFLRAMVRLQGLS